MKTIDEILCDFAIACEKQRVSKPVKLKDFVRPHKEALEALMQDNAIGELKKFAVPVEERRRADSFYGSVYVTKTSWIDSRIEHLEQQRTTNQTLKGEE